MEPNLQGKVQTAAITVEMLGARAGSLHRNLVARASNLGAPGDRAPVRQQPCYCKEKLETDQF